MPEPVVLTRAVTASLVVHMPLCAWLIFHTASKFAAPPRLESPPMPVVFLPAAAPAHSRPASPRYVESAYRSDSAIDPGRSESARTFGSDASRLSKRETVTGQAVATSAPDSVSRSANPPIRLRPIFGSRSVNIAPVHYSALSPVRLADNELAASQERTTAVMNHNPTGSSEAVFEPRPVDTGAVDGPANPAAPNRDSGAPVTSPAAESSGSGQRPSLAVAAHAELSPPASPVEAPAAQPESQRPTAVGTTAAKTEEPAKTKTEADGDGGESDAEPVFQPYPDIPDSLLDDVAKRRVWVRFDIGEDGSATARIVDSSGSREVDDIVRRACARWRFSPAKSKGRPVASTRRLRVEIR